MLGFHQKNVRTVALTMLLLSSFLGIADCAIAQEPSPRRTGARKSASPDNPAVPEQLLSELARDNLDRVAASPAQLKAVLLQDTGLMVELKSWIAKEASDNGQVLSEEDLTDAAVYRRLTNIKFRSVAHGWFKNTVRPRY